MSRRGVHRYAVIGERRVARALVALLLVAAAASGPARAVMYKWVDDKGVVHYSDKMPPDAVNKGNVELNKQGMQIRKVDPAISPEKRHATEADQAQRREEQQEAERLQKETARRDRALLDSYTTEADIDLAKTRALRTLQASVESAEAYSAQLAKRRAGLVERKAAAAGKPTADLDREIAGIDAELARQGALVAEKKRQVAEVTARYDADKARWHEIKTGAAAPAGAPAATGASGSTYPAASRK